jgi:hypothetical protein
MTSFFVKVLKFEGRTFLFLMLFLEPSGGKLSPH